MYRVLFVILLSGVSFAEEVVKVPIRCVEVVSINLSMGGGDGFINYIIVGCKDDKSNYFAVTKQLFNAWGLLGMNRLSLPSEIKVVKE